MVILLRLGLACDWATRRPADRVLARSSDLWRAFTLPEYSTRTKKEYGRLPPSANAFILAIGRYTAVYRPKPATSRQRETSRLAGHLTSIRRNRLLDAPALYRSGKLPAASANVQCPP